MNHDLFTIADLVKEVVSNKDVPVGVHDKCQLISIDEIPGRERKTFILKIANKEGYSHDHWFTFENETTVRKWGSDTPGVALKKDNDNKLKHLIHLGLAMGLQSTLTSIEGTTEFEEKFEILRNLLLENKGGRYFNMKVGANGAGKPKLSASGYATYEDWVEGKEPTLSLTENDKNNLNNMSLNTNDAVINQDSANDLDALLNS